MSDGLAATWYDGRTSRAHAVKLRLVDAVTLEVDAGLWWRHETLASVGLTTRLAGTHRTLRFEDGSLVQAADSDELHQWFGGRDALESWVDGLERQWQAALAAVVAVMLGGVLFFAYGLPRVADAAARGIPVAVEAKLGAQVESILHRWVLKPTTLGAERREKLQSVYARYASEIPGASAYRVEFANAPAIGANAFALPGGLIVVTDELVEGLTDEEVLAVLAHETGHQQNRHLMRSVLQDSAVILAAALISGDVGSAGVVVIAVPTFLVRNHYSRDFERDADEFALRTLAAAGVSPQRFADALMKLARLHANDEEEANDYLSTHPASEVRIERAVELGKAFEEKRRN